MTLQFSILHVFFFCNVLTNWGQIWFISVIDHLLLAWRLPPKNAAFFWSMSTWRNFRAAEKRQSSRVPLASLLLFSLKQPYVCLLASWCQKQQWWLKTQIFHFSHSTSWKSTLKDNLCWGIFQGFVMFESRTWERIQFMYTDRSSSSKYSKFSSKLVFLILQIVFKTQQWISIDQFYIF